MNLEPRPFHSCAGGPRRPGAHRAGGAARSTTGSQLTLVIAAALAGFGLGPVFPVTGATMSRSLRVSIAGPMLALGSLDSAVIPWLVGTISDVSHSLAIGLGSLLVNLAMLFVLHLRRRIVMPRTT